MMEEANSISASRVARGQVMTRRPSRLYLLLRHPLRLLMSIYHTVGLLIPTLAHRILLPCASSPTSFKVEILRCFLGGFMTNFWDMVFKAPPEWPQSLGGRRSYAYLRLGNEKVTAVVVPATACSMFQENKETNTANHNERAGGLQSEHTIVVLYAHGGGYFYGEPLMHLPAYNRWTRQAKAQGWELVVVSVDYSTYTFRSVLSIS